MFPNNEPIVNGISSTQDPTECREERPNVLPPFPMLEKQKIRSKRGFFRQVFNPNNGSKYSTPTPIFFVMVEAASLYIDLSAIKKAV